MAPWSVAVPPGLALGALVVSVQTSRINYQSEDTFSEELETMTSGKFKCCRIIEGILYDSSKGTVSFQDKTCKQSLHNRRWKDIVPCRTRKYHDSHVDLLNVETLPNSHCQNVPWCSAITLPRCYKITEGELSPWKYHHSSDSQQDYPPGMAISLTGKICQRSENIRFGRPQLYKHGPRWAKVEIKAAEMLGNNECEGDKWKQHGLEAAPECDDFGFWKQILSTEGIEAPNWEASIAAAKTSSPEGMTWGTPMSDMAAKDTLWNARRDTVLGVDDRLSSWS